MKKKLLSLLLATALLLTALPLMVMGVIAEEANSTEDSSAYDYESLYVTYGLRSLLTTYDLYELNETGTLIDEQGNVYTIKAVTDDAEYVARANDGSLYLGANAQLVAEDIVPTATEEGVGFTYEFVFALTGDTPANTAPATESQFSWDGAYAARPAFKVGAMNVMVEPIPADAIKNILENSVSEYVPAHNFCGGVAKSYVQFFDYWHSDYDRTSLLPALMNFNMNARSTLTFRGETRLSIKTYPGKNDDGSDLVITNHVGSLPSILRNGVLIEVDETEKRPNPSYTGDQTGVAIGGDLPMNLYSVRVYNRALDLDEINQNHFADIAASYKLDLSYFDFLSAAGKDVVYAAFASTPLDALNKTTAQDMLDKTIAALPSAKKYDYETLAAQEGLVGQITFAGASSRDVCDVTEFKDANGNLLATYTRYSDLIPDLCSWVYGNGYLKTGLNGTFNMSHLLEDLDDYSVQIVMAHNALTEEEAFFAGARKEIDPGNNTRNRVNAIYFGPVSYAFAFAANNAKTAPVKSAMMRLWNGSTYRLTFLRSDQDYDGEFQGTVLSEATGVPFNITLTNGVSEDGLTADIGVWRGAGFVKYGDTSYALPGTDLSDVESLPKKLILGAGVNTNIYTVRVYDHVLTEAEVKQNHFVDIMSLLGVSPFLFVRMTDDQKTAIYEQYAEIPLSAATDGTLTAEAIETGIAKTHLASNPRDVASMLVSFKGYQMATDDTVAARSLFALDKSLLNFAEIDAIAYVGVLTAPASTARADMTVSLDASGNVVSEASAATHTPIYKTGADASFVYNAQTVARFAGAINTEDYTAEYNVRAYVILKTATGATVHYVDTISNIFGETVDTLELATFFYDEGFKTGGIMTVVNSQAE